MAYRMQYPNRLMTSAFALIGPQGSGKSTVTHTVARLTAPYSIRLSDPDRLVGRNNASLEGKLFVQCEEMVLGGNEPFMHKLNNYITNDVIDVEDKYLRQAQVQNRLWIGMTSNSDSVVKIGRNTRRFAMYRVSDPFNGDEELRSAHFGALVAELETGGYEALLYDLLHTPIPATFNIKNVPKTPLYRELVEADEDRDTTRSWWQEVLEKGAIEGIANRDQLWTQPILKDALYRNYAGWAEQYGPKLRTAVLAKSQWAKRLGKMLPGGLTPRRIMTEGKRDQCVQLPPYGDCCDHFEQMYSCTIDRAPNPVQLRSAM
jgi:energy-coupling factor transporter ATP-binding protein EcfA2